MEGKEREGRRKERGRKGRGWKERGGEEGEAGKGKERVLYACPYFFFQQTNPDCSH